MNVIGDRAVRLRAARYEQLHHVPSPVEEEQARMLGAVLVGSKLRKLFLKLLLFQYVSLLLG